MLYCNVVESTILGAQKHSLLRKVELERPGKGRATVKPLYREWIRLRSKRVEIIELSLATPHGSLVVLPTGKTLVTLGFRRVYYFIIHRVISRTCRDVGEISVKILYGHVREIAL